LLKLIKHVKAGLFSFSPDIPKYDPFIEIRRSDPLDPNNTSRQCTKCCTADRLRFRLCNICLVSVNGVLICYIGWDPRSLQPTAESIFCLKVDTRSSHCCQKLPCGPRDSVCAAWYVEIWSVCEEQLKRKLGQGINGKIMGRSRQRTGFC